MMYYFSYLLLFSKLNYEFELYPQKLKNFNTFSTNLNVGNTFFKKLREMHLFTDKQVKLYIQADRQASREREMHEEKKVMQTRQVRQSFSKGSQSHM